MTKVLKNRNARWLDADTKNEAYAEGYRFVCNGDYTIFDEINPWSGMPQTTQNAYFFNTREEAEAFAETRTEVYEISAHTETHEEAEAREAEEKAVRKAKKEATEKAKAEAAGMTVEEYRKEKARKSRMARLEKEIAELEKELAKKKQELAKVRG